MFTQDRQQLRQAYCDAWQKQQTSQALTPLEAMIAEVISLHPEYHALLAQGEAVLDKDFQSAQGQPNPFMHMGMHIAIREQLSTNRPVGIVEIWRTLMNKQQDTHTVEHQMMECLGAALWTAQHDAAPLDEQQYLRCLQQLLT